MLKYNTATNYPSDLKRLSTNDLSALCDDIRAFLIQSLAKTGGHVGPNLGVVELSVALHYVFDTPKDKIVWDVSHQSYIHKILTGRRDGIAKLNQTGGVSGFTNTGESEYDLFNVGHTSVSISLAAGLAKARDLQKKDEHIVAIIGDGALSGGQSFEALQSAAKKITRLIIVINDNEMSIDPNNGSLYDHLRQLRENSGSNGFNYFNALGYEYIYEKNGNDVTACLSVLERAKKAIKPVVVHISTKKSKGLPFAELQQNIWHYHSPFDPITGESTVVHKFGVPRGAAKQDSTVWASPRDATSTWFKKFLSQNPSNAIVAPATQFVDSRAFYALGDRYIDVDIGEQNAVSFAAGMVKGGSNVFLMIQASFLQRAYDQIAQDWCMQNLGVHLIVVASGISSLDYSHVAMFDIALLSNIPNLVYLSPTCLKEYQIMLDWCAASNLPTAIRLASGPIEDSQRDVSAIEYGKSEIVKHGDKVAILGLGTFLRKAIAVADQLEQNGISATVINPRFITPIDTEMLDRLSANHTIVVTIEDGILEGGFGAKIALYYAATNVKVLNFGAKKEFIDHVPYDELMQRYEMADDLIVRKILKLYSNNQ
ncbi:1-deoxy-D-xylulose-5-phosphate synthase [Campylobacterota bacterium]|nr:1-deoxy-D-xylulose-5-phosphate synthase [Campylobacterota bacterium]